jgi:hypothetical protein
MSSSVTCPIYRSSTCSRRQDAGKWWIADFFRLSGDIAFTLFCSLKDSTNNRLTDVNRILLSNKNGRVARTFVECRCKTTPWATRSIPGVGSPRSCGEVSALTLAGSSKGGDFVDLLFPFVARSFACKSVISSLLVVFCFLWLFGVADDARFRPAMVSTPTPTTVVLLLLLL